jgi:hypothetical protein
MTKAWVRTAEPCRGSRTRREPSAQLAKVPGESDAAFVARIFRLGPDEANIVAADWNGVRALFVDFERGADSESPERPLYVLLQQPGGTFREVLVTLGETEGGAPDVAAISFANADRDPARELIVILSWSEPHAGACSPIDEVRILDDAKPGERALRQLPISKHFGVGCANTSKDFRYATVGAVKAELKRLGY